MASEQEMNLSSVKQSAFTSFKEFLLEVNHSLMGDLISMSNDEINRFLKMEKLLENKISRRFKVRRLDKDDFGYLIEHIYGSCLLYTSLQDRHTWIHELYFDGRRYVASEQIRRA